LHSIQSSSNFNSLNIPPIDIKEFSDNRSMSSAPIPEQRQAPTPEAHEFYYDGPYIVFTAEYHLRRGWCCQSGCRHCPYGFEKPTDAAE